MPKAVYKLPEIKNEPVTSYAPGTREREALKNKLAELNKGGIDLPMVIGGKEVRTGTRVDIRPPHDHQRVLGHYHQGDRRCQGVARRGDRAGWNVRQKHRVLYTSNGDPGQET